jgi:hypothetical protein
VQRPVEFMIVSQYMYPKSFTYQSAMLPRETSMQELKQTRVVLTLNWVSVSFFPMQLANSCNCHSQFPMLDNWNLME